MLDEIFIKFIDDKNQKVYVYKVKNDLHLFLSKIEDHNPDKSKYELSFIQRNINNLYIVYTRIGEK